MTFADAQTFIQSGQGELHPFRDNAALAGQAAPTWRGLAEAATRGHIDVASFWTEPFPPCRTPALTSDGR